MLIQICILNKILKNEFKLNYTIKFFDLVILLNTKVVRVATLTG